MTIRNVAALTAAAALTAVVTTSAPAQSTVKVGTLNCDVSAGVGMILTQKQTMTCAFTPDAGGPPDRLYRPHRRIRRRPRGRQPRHPDLGCRRSGFRGASWSAGGNLHGRRRAGDRGRRPRRQCAGRRNRPGVLPAAALSVGADRPQHRRRRDNRHAHVGALTSRNRDAAGGTSPFGAMIFSRSRAHARPDRRQARRRGRRRTRVRGEGP